MDSLDAEFAFSGELESYLRLFDAWVRVPPEERPGTIVDMLRDEALDAVLASSVMPARKRALVAAMSRSFPVT